MLYKPLISMTNPNTIKTYRIISNSHSCSFPGFHGAKSRCVSEIRKLAQFLWDFFPEWKQGGGRGKKKNNLTEISLSSILKSSGVFEQNGNIKYSGWIFIAPDKG